MLAWGSSHKRNDHFELQPSNLIFNPSHDTLTLVFIVSSVYVGNVRPYLAHAFAQDSPVDHLCAREEPEGILSGRVNGKLLNSYLKPRLGS